MKVILSMLFALLFVFSAAACAPERESDSPPEKNGDILVVYFSRTGNTQKVAKEIAAQTRGELAEILPTTPYPAGYAETLEIARRERAEDARPALSEQTLSLNAEKYAAVLIGYPIWHGDEPRIIRSFFDAYGGFAGQNVYLFSTSGSSGGGAAVNHLRNLYPNAIIGESLHLTSSALENAPSFVKDWLDGLHIGKAARIEMEVSGEKIYASLADNAAAKEFADRLAKGETTLAFSDFAGAEKIAYPSPPFMVSDSEGCDPEIGDLTIYKPWGNIAVFYRDSSGYSSDLVYLGKIEGDGIGILAAQSGDFTVTLRLAGG